MNVAHRRASPMARAGTVAMVGAPAAAQVIKERSVKFPIVNNIDLASTVRLPFPCVLIDGISSQEQQDSSAARR